MNENTETRSPARIARIAGVLYLVIMVTAGFSEGYVRASLIAPGDAAQTAANIMASESLFRAGLVGDLIAFTSDAAVAILLYVLLRPVNKTLSLLAASFRLIAHPAIGGLNLVNHFAAVLLLGGSGSLGALGPGQTSSLALFFLQAHTAGYLIAGVFFGISLLFLGLLVRRVSGVFPKVLGILLILAAAGYLIESLGKFLVPAYRELYGYIVAVTAVIGELGLTLWLLIKAPTPGLEPGAA